MVEQVDKDTSDGAVLGKATTSKVGFFGKTPVVQPTVADNANVATVVTALKSLGLFK